MRPRQGQGRGLLGNQPCLSGPPPLPAHGCLLPGRSPLSCVPRGQLLSLWSNIYTLGNISTPIPIHMCNMPSLLMCTHTLHSHTACNTHTPGNIHAPRPVHTCNTPCPCVHTLYAHILGNIHIPGNMHGNIPIPIHTWNTPCPHAHTLGHVHTPIPTHRHNTPHTCTCTHVHTCIPTHVNTPCNVQIHVHTHTQTPTPSPLAGCQRPESA